VKRNLRGKKSKGPDIKGALISIYTNLKGLGIIGDRHIRNKHPKKNKKTLRGYTENIEKLEATQHKHTKTISLKKIAKRGERDKGRHH